MSSVAFVSGNVGVHAHLVVVLMVVVTVTLVGNGHVHVRVLVDRRIARGQSGIQVDASLRVGASLHIGASLCVDSVGASEDIWVTVILVTFVGAGCNVG